MFFLFIKNTISLNNSKSFLFKLTKGYLTKCGIITSVISFNEPTEYWITPLLVV